MYAKVLFWVDVAVAFTTIIQNLIHGVFQIEESNQLIPIMSDTFKYQSSLTFT
jgi:hypothetical protein